MALKTLSLILYAAYHSQMPCEKVFVDTAKAANIAIDFSAEEKQLEEFAKAACETSNPDIFWLIAQQESNFRFSIVRENGETPKIHKGKDAVQYLENLKAQGDSVDAAMKSVDIGVLQFNWRWHRDGFRKDPMVAVSPKQQVEYFLKQYGQEVFRRCEDRWVGCYHHQTDVDRADKYQSAVQKKSKRFVMLTLYFLRDQRKMLTAEERKMLPPIVKDDFYKVFQLSTGFPLPHKQIMNIVHDSEHMPRGMMEAEG